MARDVTDITHEFFWIVLLSVVIVLPALVVWNIMLKVRQWLGGE